MRFRDRPLLVDGIDADLYVPRPDLESLLLEKILAHRNILLVGPSGSGKSTALHKLAVDLRNAGQRAVLVNAGAGRSASDLLALVANELDLPDLQPDPNLGTPVVSLVRSVRQLAQAPASVILLDDPHHPDSAYELFGRLREELWALPHQWVVAIRAGQSPSLRRPPADAFFPEVGIATLELLERLGCEVIYPLDQTCCGQPMELLVEKTDDAGKEKHVPVVVPGDGVTVVKVGSVPHPMEEKHYIEWVEVTVNVVTEREYLKPGELPEAKFCSCGEVSQARIYCNIHGLWKS